ncbi:MAG: sulfatase [Chloroflexi bacterium]|nr:sulfatase [Chloroflexota bacterium]OJV90108.1 MAG: sulfatase [Chloroflexi bacterium 54-19]
MKAIFVCFDTLCRRMLPNYGNDWIKAPNFARLAERTVTFDTAYVGSMPCMPARREFHTGRYNFLHRSWGPLEPFDESTPEILTRHGVYTHIVTDHQHYWEDGGGSYLQRYRTFEMVRGQEGDPWKGHVADPEIPDGLKKQRGEMYRQDWINRSYMKKEEAMPQAQVFGLGAEFIRTNRAQDNWFLQIETFDPHEPFFTQPEYKKLYPHNYTGPHYDWPDYAPVTETPEQVEHVRYEYAALLSMCDHYLGTVIDLMDELNMWDDTLLIVSTDHGFLLGEHDWWAKAVQPWYQEIAHIPLFVWDPRSRKQGERRQSLAQWIDFAPTLLEYFNVPIPETMQGTSLKDKVNDDKPGRPAGLFGIHGGHVNITDGRYVYMRAPVEAANNPLFEYTLMPNHMRNRFGVEELQNLALAEPFNFTRGMRPLKIESRGMRSAHSFGTMLFDLDNDPKQDNPIIDDEVERRMIGLMVEWMKWNDAPAEQFERLGLPADGEIRPEHLLLARQHAQALKAREKRVPLPPYTGPGAVFLKQPLKEIITIPEGKALVEKYFAFLLDSSTIKMVSAASIEQIASYMPGSLTPASMEGFAREMADRADGELNGATKEAGKLQERL